jgi:hypothetical protein
MIKKIKGLLLIIVMLATVGLAVLPFLIPANLLFKDECRDISTSLGKFIDFVIVTFYTLGFASILITLAITLKQTFDD